ncbi:hypothetical protein C8R46DRAFT_815401, partial [Mycena filopes]
AAAKLWAVYISETEKYDKGLVESWKADMEGLLIFVCLLDISIFRFKLTAPIPHLQAGLFSAILTAFLIESYKTLNSDSGDLTVQLLMQISQQMAATANGTTLPTVPTAPFSPKASAIACNALWFASLAFSLTSALVATFVQQWARDFLHKTELHSAPVIRARIFSYLYYGMKILQMHTMVEVIPLLIHQSLLFFFGSLIAFLIPVNIAMAGVVAAVLLVVVAAYVMLTLLPLYHLDCPYHTPLSGPIWRVLKLSTRIWYHLQWRL